MSFQHILVEQVEGIRIITMNRPEKKNSLNENMAKELLIALEQGEADSQTAVAVLRGQGGTFCAGGDLGDFAKLNELSAPEIYRQGEETTKLFKKGQKLSKPLIGWVEGKAVGGGMGLAAMCHYVLAEEKAEFALPEIKVGMFPFVILPLIVRVLGARRAMELALTGDTIDAQEAWRLGLVSKVVPAEQLADQVMKLAKQMAGYSPVVIKLGMDAYKTAVDMEMEKAMDYLNTIRVIDLLSADLREGVAAFFAKRNPVWKGK